MPANEQLQRSLSNAFVNTMRQTDLINTLKVPEVLFLFGTKFDQIFQSGILNLEQIYQDMSSVQGVEQEDLAGLMLLYREQAQGLGVQMQLPADLIVLPPDKKQALLDRIRKQIERRLKPAEEASQRPSKQEKAGKITLGGDSSRARKWLLLTAGVLIVISIAVNVAMQAPSKPDIAPVAGIDLAALGLPGGLHFKESIFLLKVPRAEWDAIPRYEQRERLQALVKLLLPKGLYTIIVQDLNLTTLVVGGMSDLHYLDQQAIAQP